VELEKIRKDIRNGEIKGIAAGAARPLFILKIRFKKSIKLANSLQHFKICT